jgi:hypothetical protein
MSMRKEKLSWWYVSSFELKDQLLLFTKYCPIDIQKSVPKKIKEHIFEEKMKTYI